MTGAQRGTSAAPFSRALAEGYLFRSRAMRDAFAGFVAAEKAASAPCLILGPDGIGKTTILEAYLEERAEAGVLTISLEARVLEAGRVAEMILAGFGQEAAEGASVRLALHDFIEDASAEGVRPIVAVDGLDDADPAALLELASLARPPEAGGTGFVLIASSRSEAAAKPIGVKPLELPNLGPDEIEALLDQVLRSGGIKLTLTEDANAALKGETGGLIGQIGPLLDAAVDRCLEDNGQRLERQHVTGEVTGKQAPSANDIEAAILALGSEPQSYEELDRAFDELRHPAARSYKPFPQKGTTTGEAPQAAPGIDPRVVTALEEVSQTLGELRRALGRVRHETGQLEKASGERQRRIGDAAASFVNTLQIPQPSSSEE